MSSRRPLPDLTALPPGPVLAAVLEELDPETLPADLAVTVLRAWSRQRSHDRARLTRTLARVAALTRQTGLRRRADGDWAGSEIAAALTWSDGRAARELWTAEILLGLPLVSAAFDAGRIDDDKAWVFADVLGCAELTPTQTEAVCTALVPPASRWTAAQLRARLMRAVLAIDPEWSARRYRDALSETAVHGYLSADGTAVITATGLPAAEAAAACVRVDRLAAELRRAGHPGTLPQIRSRVFLRLLDNSLTGLTHPEIVATLLAEAGVSPGAPTPPGPGGRTDGSDADEGAPDESAPDADDPDRDGSTSRDPDRGDPDRGDPDSGRIEDGDPTLCGPHARVPNDSTPTDDGPTDAGPMEGDRRTPARQKATRQKVARPMPARPMPVRPMAVRTLAIRTSLGWPTSAQQTLPRTTVRRATAQLPARDPPGPTEVGARDLGRLDRCPARREPRAGPPRPTGVEVRVGLLTLLGLDHRPGELPGREGSPHRRWRALYAHRGPVARSPTSTIQRRSDEGVRAGRPSVRRRARRWR